MLKKKKWFILLTFLFMLFSLNLVAMADTEEGLEEQFEYNETSARNVKVNVTVSYDGVPIMSSDEKDVIAYKEVTVPYFDLGNYGLENFYRYPTDEGKNYISGSEVVRRPTVLHLYIYLIEKYYLDVETRYIGTGEAKDYLFGRKDSGVTVVKNLLGNTAYSVAGRAPMALEESQGACHMYMTNFWGYSANLNYYVNHWWPLWKDGGSFGGMQLFKTGATADYILLEDGDLVELAMFTSEGFIANGKKGFAYFPQMEYVIREGDTLNVEYIKRAREGKECLTDHVKDEVSLYECFGTDKSGSVVIEAVMDAEGKTLTFSGFDEPGTYYIYGLQKGHGTEDAGCDPAVAKVVVQEAVSASVQDVLDKISAIGEVTYSDECKAKLDEARTAYDALSDEEKELIFDDELTVLFDAEKIFGELKLEADKKAEEEKKKAEEEAKKKAEEEAKKKAEEETKKKAEEAAKKKAEEEAKKKAEEEAKKKAEEEAKKKAEIAKIKKIKNSKISSFKSKKYKKKGVKLTWKKNKNLIGYKIYQSTKKNKGFKQIKSTKKTSITITKGLKKGKTYYFKIQGYAKVGKKTINSKTKIIKYKVK